MIKRKYDTISYNLDLQLKKHKLYSNNYDMVNQYYMKCFSIRETYYDFDEQSYEKVVLLILLLIQT